MKALDWVRSVWQDHKAKKRGEVRVAPREHTGRVYAKLGEAIPIHNEDGKVIRFTRKPIARLTMKITRADGTIEHIEVPSEVTLNG